MIQRSTDLVFAGGCDYRLRTQLLHVAALSGAAFASSSFCGWQRLRVAAFARGVFLRMAALSPPIECQIGLNIDRAGNCKTEYQLICLLSLNK
ncbi:hypothetical protein, partial [Flavitalea sp.]|nr:hypothetical protein [Flavitalea sp.]